MFYVYCELLNVNLPFLLIRLANSDVNNVSAVLALSSRTKAAFLKRGSKIVAFEYKFDGSSTVPNRFEISSIKLFFNNKPQSVIVTLLVTDY